MKTKIKLISFVAIVIGLLLFQGCTTAGGGYVGIKIKLAGDNRGIQDYTIETGRIFYNPFTEDVLTYPTFIQRSVWTKDSREGSESNEEISFSDKDGMVITADISYSYKIIKSKVPAFYVEFKTDNIQDFTDGYAFDRIQGAFNRLGSKRSVEEIIEKKDIILDSAKAYVNSRLEQFGVVFTELEYIGAVRPPEAIINRINSKNEATQLAMQLENEVRQEEATADKKVAFARGEANSMIEKARGDSASVVIRKSAEAEGNRLVSTSITPNLLKWRKLDIDQRQIEKWKGDVPKITGQSGGMILQGELGG